MYRTSVSTTLENLSVRRPFSFNAVVPSEKPLIDRRYIHLSYLVFFLILESLNQYTDARIYEGEHHGEGGKAVTARHGLACCVPAMLRRTVPGQLRGDKTVAKTNGKTTDKIDERPVLSHSITYPRTR